MRTKVNAEIVRAIFLAGVVISVIGCSNSEKKDGGTEATNNAATPTASEVKVDAPVGATGAFAQNEVEMGDYHFKLSPDIQKNGEAHLDFYCLDKNDKHVLGLTGTFHITMPDGSKETLAIEEEKPHDHYHGKLMLTQYGEYRVTAQVTVGGQKLNPRFTFARKQAP